MVYGITGNPHKDQMWEPVAELISWLMRRDLPFCLHETIADGLAERDLAGASVCTENATSDLADASDLVLSYGGDGTLLRTAHHLGDSETPIMGINIGRLGFLADVDTGEVEGAIDALEAGDYHVEKRLVLKGDTRQEQDRTEDTDMPALDTRWALNEFVVDRSGETGLLAIDVRVDGTPLNTYWADGLIVATPTGSTAYSLSAGGPLLTPGTDAVVLTPIAPHTLTVRPIVLPADATIDVRIEARGQAYVLAADGRNSVIDATGVVLSIERAGYTVNLAKLDGQDYFKTLRNKLMWGANAVSES